MRSQEPIPPPAIPSDPSLLTTVSGPAPFSHCFSHYLLLCLSLYLSLCLSLPLSASLCLSPCCHDDAMAAHLA